MSGPVPCSCSQEIRQLVVSIRTSISMGSLSPLPA